MLDAVLFDVNETLTDLAPLGAVWGRPELGHAMLHAAIESAMVDAVTDRRGRPFADHLRSGVASVAAAHGLDAACVDDALARAAGLPARPGAGDALDALVAGGLTVAALTNSGAAGGRATLEANGLLARFDPERVLGVDAVGTFKPHPDVYGHALAVLGVAADRVAMVAVHPWDLAGAAAGGMRTAWVRHGMTGWPSAYPTPDWEAETLPEIAALLLGAAG